MKDKKQKISFDKRYLLLLVAGFLTGRVWLYGINPFGVALFAAVAAERKGRKLLALFVLAGMFSSTEGLSACSVTRKNTGKVDKPYRTGGVFSTSYRRFKYGGRYFKQYSCSKYMGSILAQYP